jgi:hypothetical protein
MFQRSVLIAALALTACIDGEESEDVSTGYHTCSEYQLMLDVELKIGQQCSTDSDCDQVLSGTGCGCETDELVVNHIYETRYFHEIHDEALAAGCSPSFGTTCACPTGVTTVCDAGTCDWGP